MHRLLGHEHHVGANHLGSRRREKAREEGTDTEAITRIKMHRED